MSCRANPDIDVASVPSNQSRKPHQCGAICWRLDQSGKVVILLVTSRGTGRWIIPKGNLRKRESQYECARREAFEEAGVTGRIGKRPLGNFIYYKRERQQWLTVSVFPLLVSQEADEFPETGLRQRCWLPIEEAAACLNEPDLRAVFRSLEDHACMATAPSPFADRRPGKTYGA